MDGGEDEIILVEQRSAGLLAAGRGGIQHDVLEEGLAAGVGRRDRLELIEIAEPRRHPVIEPLELGPIPFLHQAELGGPIHRPAGEQRQQGCQPRPILRGGGRHLEARQGVEGEAGLLQVIQRLARRGRADARQEMQAAETRHPVAGILRPAEQADHVLDMGGLDEFQPAEFDERDVAPRQLQLQGAAVVGSPEQHGLLLEGSAGLARRQHPAGHIARLGAVVMNGHQPRPLLRRPFAEEILGEALPRLLDHRIARRQDRLGRAVVLLQGDDFRRRAEQPGEVQDVAHRRGAEAVDRLGIVAHDGETPARGPEAQQDRGLQRVGVLVFVHQHMVEALGHQLCQLRRAHHLGPVEQQIVVVEQALALLGRDIGAEQPAQLRLPALAPGEAPQQHLAQRRLGVHRIGIDGEAGLLLGKAALLAGKPELVAEQVHEVGTILAVEDGEGGVEADVMGMQPEEPGADGMEGPRPGQGRRRRAALVSGPGRDPLDPALHLGRRPAGEGQQQDPLGRHALADQKGDPMGQGIGFTRACAGDDEKGRRVVRPGAGPAIAQAMPGGPPLCGVQILHAGVGVHAARISGPPSRRKEKR